MRFVSKLCLCVRCKREKVLRFKPFQTKSNIIDYTRKRLRSFKSLLQAQFFLSFLIIYERKISESKNLKVYCSIPPMALIFLLVWIQIFVIFYFFAMNLIKCLFFSGFLLWSFFFFFLWQLFTPSLCFISFLIQSREIIFKIIYCTNFINYK